MKIDIYIITLWKGTNFAKGSGAYGILLEVVKDGTPYTKEHYAGWENLSYPKLQLRAVVDALSYVTRPCDIKVHIDSGYVTGNWETKKSGKNAELWEALRQKAMKMDNVEIVLDGKHEYASYLTRQVEAGKYPAIKDQ